MSRLEEIRDLVLAKAEELDVEGNDIVQYWFARCNIDRDEYLDMSDDMIRQTFADEFFQSLSGFEKLRVLVLNGFILGLAFGRGKEDSEF